MKLKIESRELKRLAAVVKPAVMRSGPLASIVNQVLIRADGAEITMAGTDTNIQIIARGKAEADQFAAVLNMDRLMTACAAAEVLEFTGENDVVKVKAGRGRMTLATSPIDHFPLQDPQRNLVRVDVQNLAERLRSVVFSASRNDIRHYLNGVHLEADSKSGTVHFVATDGFRLATVSDHAEGLSQSVACIIPTAVVNQLISMQPSLLMVSDRELVACGDGYELLSRLIDGRYPDWRRLIPRECEYRSAVDRGELLRLLGIAAGFVQFKNPAAAIRLDTEFQISSCNDNAETFESGVPASGNQRQFNMNVDFLRQGLEWVSDESVVLQWDTTETAAAIAINQGKWWYVAMPLRV
ncbi:DNA polymerase III subunit beta [Chitiniphilus eburneus]|uniref:Beta sliding clamp n=1 Tax=Chitiniphilus eburneus TaxID=2571148 RepID=A0A4U0PYU5_9NEIS|nr:DNA polymerase III subunit beta [Chitiniphilus eburneus]TJZ73767.1 DNA polymerase III subunit beta [Chitiniphilus eburneus]